MPRHPEALPLSQNLLMSRHPEALPLLQNPLMLTPSMPLLVQEMMQPFLQVLNHVQPNGVVILMITLMWWGIKSLDEEWKSTILDIRKALEAAHE
jgi:hypothetical protein